MPTQKIDPKVIFASNAPAIDKPPVFGDKTKGFDVTRSNDGRPTIKQMNKLQQDTDLKILWLNENAVLPYDASIDYPDGAVTLKDGSLKQKDGENWNDFLDDFASLDLVKRGIGNVYDGSLPYNINDRVLLNDGTEVISTIANNTNDPNVNLTGWVKANSASQILDESGLSQQEINNSTIKTVQSIEELLSIKNPKDGDVRYVKSYYQGLNAGGRKCTYSSSRSSDNDGIFVFNGWVSESILNLTPEHAGAKANDSSFDNSEYLNRAFATSIDIYSTPDKTYYVNGILNSKGQKCIGGWSINSTRSDGSASGKLGLIKTTTEGVDAFSVRMLYLESAYDLTELFIIKSLGFNTINHYGYFENNPIDAGGTVQKLLDNCLTAGLQVNLGTESSAAQSDINTFINNSQFHKALWGYSVYDEPATRGITVAQQDYKIDMLRSLTDKQLSFVDLIADGGAFNQKFSTKYDIAFVDSYSLHYATGTLPEWLEKDLSKMRADYGIIKAMTKLNRVIPVVSAYLNSGYYSNNIDQVVQASKIFGTIDEGNFGAFCWDGTGDTENIDNVRKNQTLRNLVSGLASQKVRKKLETDVCLFGQAGSSTAWGIRDLLDRLVVKDPFTIMDNVWGSAYPIILKQGASDTDRTSTAITTSYSGLGMKGNYSAIPLNMKTRKNVRCILEYFHTTLNPEGTFYLQSTDDGGYTLETLYADGFSNNKTFDFNSVGHGDSTVILRVETTGDTSNFYRKLLRGIIICSDW